MLFLGYLELKHFKAYQKESEIYARLNPVQKRIFDNQENILKRLDDTEKECKKIRENI